jgi:hypothetical protein
MGLDTMIHVDGYKTSQETHEACVRANTRLAHLGIGDDPRYPDEYDKDEYDKFVIYINDDGSTYASFNTHWRYWGKGYERGPLFNIIGVIKTAMWAFEGRTVYYGHDCANGPLREIDNAGIDELWAHYMGPEGDSYCSS